MLGQIVSIIGMVLNIASFQMRTRKQILLVQTAGSFMFCLSYFLLQSWAGFCLNGLFVFRNIIFYYGKDKKWAQHIVWLPVFLCGVVIAGGFSARSWADWLPVIGSLFGTVAMYMKHENLLRLLKLCDSPCWLVYNCTIPSMGGILCEVFNLISIVVGLIRFRKEGLFRAKKL